jgi:hypothetical protein
MGFFPDDMNFPIVNPSGPYDNLGLVANDE